MKKFIFIIPLIFIAIVSTAQAPAGINYQTVIRDSNGSVMSDTEVSFQIRIRTGAPDGEIVYTETHSLSTNNFGLASLIIGQGIPQMGNFSAINWSIGEKYFETAIDTDGNGNYNTLGVTQFLSVPYSINAANGIQTMTLQERDALENPFPGMQIYNATTKCMNYYSGNAWFEMCGTCSPMPSQAYAGEDQLDIYGESAILQANAPESGTGMWDILSGSGGVLEDATDPGTIFTGLPDETYILQWKIFTVCDTTYDEVMLALHPWACGFPFIDFRDGRQYETVLIGEQCWMAENLAYLPVVDIPSQGNNTDPYYYVYNYQGSDVAEAMTTANFQNYGALYNWPAAILACPEEWHLPADGEWTILTDYLGGTGIAGGKLKSTRTAPEAHPRWDSPNSGASNSSGFSGLPGGYRLTAGTFLNLGVYAYFWSSTENLSANAWYRLLYFNNAETYRLSYAKGIGLPVRCVKSE